jgi:hypothetical protein
MAQESFLMDSRSIDVGGMACGSVNVCCEFWLKYAADINSLRTEYSGDVSVVIAMFNDMGNTLQLLPRISSQAYSQPSFFHQSEVERHHR